MMTDQESLLSLFPDAFENRAVKEMSEEELKKVFFEKLLGKVTTIKKLIENSETIVMVMMYQAGIMRVGSIGNSYASMWDITGLMPMKGKEELEIDPAFFQCGLKINDVRAGYCAGWETEGNESVMVYDSGGYQVEHLNDQTFPVGIGLRMSGVFKGRKIGIYGDSDRAYCEGGKDNGLTTLLDDRAVGSTIGYFKRLLLEGFLNPKGIIEPSLQVIRSEESGAGVGLVIDKFWG